uniref:Uncharacterized protein n=1 Tax=Anguilla anguilla TaxID=7936 RepID=A0A0E9U657_ANGAN
MSVVILKMYGLPAYIHHLSWWTGHTYSE